MLHLDSQCLVLNLWKRETTTACHLICHWGTRRVHTVSLNVIQYCPKAKSINLRLIEQAIENQNPSAHGTAWKNPSGCFKERITRVSSVRHRTGTTWNMPARQPLPWPTNSHYPFLQGPAQGGKGKLQAEFTFSCISVEPAPGGCCDKGSGCGLLTNLFHTGHDWPWPDLKLWQRLSGFTSYCQVSCVTQFPILYF